MNRAIGISLPRGRKRTSVRANCGFTAIRPANAPSATMRPLPPIRKRIVWLRGNSSGPGARMLCNSARLAASRRSPAVATTTSSSSPSVDIMLLNAVPPLPVAIERTRDQFAIAVQFIADAMKEQRILARAAAKRRPGQCESDAAEQTHQTRRDPRPPRRIPCQYHEPGAKRQERHKGTGACNQQKDQSPRNEGGGCAHVFGHHLGISIKVTQDDRHQPPDQRTHWLEPRRGPRFSGARQRNR